MRVGNARRSASYVTSQVYHGLGNQSMLTLRRSGLLQDRLIL